jgi:hypothetical protein
MMIEGPLDSFAVSIVGYVRRLTERKAEAERERRLRIIRNLPRNRHAWKGKRT